jgi:hypothetical protein
MVLAVPGRFHRRQRIRTGFNDAADRFHANGCGTPPYHMLIGQDAVALLQLGGGTCVPYYARPGLLLKGGGIAAVVFVVVGQQNVMNRKVADGIQSMALHMVLAGVDEQAVQIIKKNAHDRRPDRTVAQLNGSHRAECIFCT